MLLHLTVNHEEEKLPDETGQPYLTTRLTSGRGGVTIVLGWPSDAEVAVLLENEEIEWLPDSRIRIAEELLAKLAQVRAQGTGKRTP